MSSRRQSGRSRPAGSGARRPALLYLLLPAALLLHAGCGGRGGGGAGIEPIEITDDNFEQTVLASPLPVVVDIWAPWCRPCVEMAPAVRLLAKEFQGQAVVGKLNADENPATCRRYQIEALPTVLFFVDGQLAVRAVGRQRLVDLRLQIQELIRQQQADRESL